MLALRSLGFGLWVSWLWALFLEGPLLTPTAERWQFAVGTLFMFYMLCNAASLLYIGLRLRPGSLTAGGVFLPAGVAAMTVGPLLLAFIPCLALPPLTWLLPLLTLLSAFGGAIMGAGWVESFAKMRLGDSAMVFAGGAVIAGAGTMAAAHVDYFAGMVVVALLPAASCLLLKRQGAADDLPAAAPPPHEVNPYTAKLVVLFALFYVAGGLMFKIVSLEQTYPYLFYLANGSYAVVCLAAGLALYYKPSIDLRFLYRPVLPFLGVGFIFFVANVGVALLPFLLLQAGFALFDMYTWLLIAYLARFHGRPATVCCLGLFLITFFIFCGNLVYALWTGLAGEASVNSLAMVAGVLCLLAAMVFSDNRETFSGWEIPASEAKAADRAPDGGAADAKATAAARAALLTAREREVLGLLLRGRNNIFIGEALNISVNTVKYHIRNLYEKFQVSSRQELLDTIEKLEEK